MILAERRSYDRLPPICRNDTVSVCDPTDASLDRRVYHAPLDTAHQPTPARNMPTGRLCTEKGDRFPTKRLRVPCMTPRPGTAPAMPQPNRAFTPSAVSPLSENCRVEPCIPTKEMHPGDLSHAGYVSGVYCAAGARLLTSARALPRRRHTHVFYIIRRNISHADPFQRKNHRA